MADTMVNSRFILPIITLVALVNGVGGAGESCRLSAIQSGTGLRRCLTDIATVGKRTIDPYVFPTTTTLKVYMDLVFRSRPETYDFCCDSMDVSGGVYRLNPLDQTLPDNHLLRRAPYITFYPEASSGFAFGDTNYYTIACYDVTSTGKPWVHWMLGNIRGLDMSSVRQWYSYIHLTEDRNYVFVLYKQNGNHMGDVTFFGSDNVGDFCIESRCGFDIKLAEQSFGMQVIGISWVKPRRTRYVYYNYFSTFGAKLSNPCGTYTETPQISGSTSCPSISCDTSKPSFNVNSCLGYVKTGGRQLAPTVVANNLDLKIYMEATFTVNDFSLEICCRTEHYSASSYTVKTVDKPRPLDWQLIYSPSLTFKNKAGINYGTSADSGWYTVALYDIETFTQTGKSDPNAGKYYIHWLVANFQKLKLSDGQVILPYLAPVGRERKFLMVLYRHTSKRTGININSYVASSNCFAGTSNRCRFDAPRFATTQAMTVVSLLWFYPEHNAYSVYHAYTVIRSSSQVTLCPQLNPEITVSGTRLNCPATKCAQEEAQNSISIPNCLTATTVGAAYSIPEVVPSNANLRLHLDMTFTTQDKGINQCCVTKTIRGTTIKHNPLDRTQNLVFAYKTKPVIEIKAKDAATTVSIRSSQFLLLLLDVDLRQADLSYSYSRFYLRWAVSNIQNLQVNNGEEVTSYLAPATSHMVAALLYKQSRAISNLNTYTTNTNCDGQRRCSFELNQLIKDESLELYGASWINPKQTDLTQMIDLLENRGQPAKNVCPLIFPGLQVSNANVPSCATASCTTSIIQNPNTVGNCLSSLLGSAKTSVRPWADDITDLAVYIKTTYTAISSNYKVCCKTYTVPAAQLTPNPLQWTWPDGAQLRLQPLVEFIVKQGASSTLAGRSANDYYTLILVDVGGDQPSGAKFSPEKPFLHWAVANIQAMNFQQGVALISYLPPTAPRTHMYMLFKQTTGRKTFNIANYVSGSCYPGTTNRCNFDLKRFMADYNLTPVGLSWITPADTPYTAYSQMIDLKTGDKADICRKYEPDVEIWYDQPWCSGDSKPTPPTPSAAMRFSKEGTTYLSLILLIISLLVA